MRNKIGNWLPIVLILLLGAFLRLYRIADYMTFLGDEGRDVLVVKRILIDHRPTLLGPTASVGGFFLGPIYYYFMLPFLWLFRLDPVGPAIMVALFGVATTFLVYKVGKDFFDKKTGLIAASLYSVSPLVIAYSRSSWNPNPLPFFSLLTLFTFYQAVKQKAKWFSFIGGILLGMAFQFHYLAVFLAVIVFVYLFLMEVRNFKFLLKHYFLTALGLLIGFSPFLAFELKHGFPNLQTIFRFVLNSDHEVGFVGENAFSVTGNVLFRLFWRLLTRFPPLNQVNLFQDLTTTIWYWLIIFLIFGSLGLFLYQLWRAGKEKSKGDWPKLSLIFLWLFLGVGLFSFYKKPIYDYYLGFMFPLSFLLMGNFLEKIMKSWRPVSIVGFLIFVLLLVNNLEGVPFRFRPNRQLEQTKTISRFVMEKASGKPFNFALITGQNSDHAYRYFLEIWGNPPITIENTQKDPERKTVTDQLLIICEISDCKPLGHPLWEVAGFGRAEIEGEWQVSVVKVFKLVHYQRET